jgi:hypothetical protein
MPSVMIVEPQFSNLDWWRQQFDQSGIEIDLVYMKDQVLLALDDKSTDIRVVVLRHEINEDLLPETMVLVNRCRVRRSDLHIMIIMPQVTPTELRVAGHLRTHGSEVVQHRQQAKERILEMLRGPDTQTA